MIDADKKQFATIMVGTAELYEKKPSKELMQMYFNALQRFSIEQVSQGFSAHINDPERGMFMPKPADVIRNIPKEQPKLLEEKPAIQVCENTLELVRKYGDRLSQS